MSSVGFRGRSVKYIGARELAPRSCFEGVRQHATWPPPALMRSGGHVNWAWDAAVRRSVVLVLPYDQRATSRTILPEVCPLSIMAVACRISASGRTATMRGLTCPASTARQVPSGLCRPVAMRNHGPSHAVSGGCFRRRRLNEQNEDAARFQHTPGTLLRLHPLPCQAPHPHHPRQLEPAAA